MGAGKVQPEHGSQWFLGTEIDIVSVYDCVCVCSLAKRLRGQEEREEVLKDVSCSHRQRLDTLSLPIRSISEAVFGPVGDSRAQLKILCFIIWEN